MELPSPLLDTCRQAISNLDKKGAMPAGHNGPYFHEETPLRNTSHWLFCWSMLYRHTGETCFREAVESSLRYVSDPLHRKQGGNWRQRSHPGRDSCNGVIGAAWTGEALWAAARVLDKPDLLDAARDVLERHAFDDGLGLWHRWEVNGKTLSIDQTFNHQLWFAATAARCGKNSSGPLFQRCERFMDTLDTHFEVQPSGLIQHRISLGFLDRLFRSGTVFHWGFNVIRSLRSRRMLFDTPKRDIGYHCFNFIAFAVLKTYFLDHPFWHSPQWLAALSYAQSYAFGKAMDQPNKYAFPYNPVGFEMAAALRVFIPESETRQKEWWELQWDRLTSASSSESYGDNCQDPAIAKARLYEGVEALRLGVGDVL